MNEKQEVKQKSIKLNLLMNVVKTLMGILFPLISFPYASRVLGTVGIGKVNYANSICSYFVLIAGLGISTYAIREGGSFRDDKEKLGKFATEMFVINICSTIVSLVAFGVVLLLPEFRDYRGLLLLMSLTIPFSTIGLAWLYQILEEYTRITLQAIAFQGISLVLLFVLVHDPSDYMWYGFITVFANVGSNLLYFVSARKYIRLFGYKNYEIKKHLKPIFIIFGMTIASTIYLNLDVSMLGYIKGDDDVGIYSAAIKLSNIVCSLITSLSTVILARLSYYLYNDAKEKYDKLLYSTANFILFLAFPCAVGLCILSRPLILLISGIGFVAGTRTMQILSFRVILSPISGFLAYQVLMPLKKEKYSMYATIVGCIVDIILNAVLIPRYTYDGAAIATLFAEMCVVAVCFIAGRKAMQFSKLIKNIAQYVGGIIVILLVASLLQRFIANEYLQIVAVTAFGGLGYIVFLMLLKNEFMIYIWQEAVRTIKKLRKGQDK